MTSGNHGHDGHSHGSGADMDEQAKGILRRGIAEILDMTEGLQFRPLISEKFPLPLARVDYPAVPDTASLRDEIRSDAQDNPLRALLKVLALVELYECNQPDITGYLLEDMKFVGTCFSSKRCNGWIAVMGDADREQVEREINGQWQFKFFSGPARPTGIYVLLSMLARYAYVYGQIESGQSHDLSHFVEDFCPGLLVCRGRLSDLELTLSLAAMKMGVPAIVPDDYPFALGKTIRADAVEDIAACVVAFANIRRLLDIPEIPRLPDYCDPVNLAQEITPAVTWGDDENSFIIVRKGAVKSPGFSVTGQPDRSIGITVTIDAEPMDEWDCNTIERTIATKPSMMDGVDATFNDNRFTINQAAGVDLDPNRIGEVLVAAVGNQFPRLKDRVNVVVRFDAKKLKSIAVDVRAEKLARQQTIDSATEDNLDWFVGCTGCSPFAPDHICVLTPQRRPQCGRDMGLLKTNALYGYDDMSNIHHSRLQAGVNSFQIIDKGQCIDPLRGEWTGSNDYAARMTQGRTSRVQLHSLDEVPHTGCGCFRLILFKTDKPRDGIGVMQRGCLAPCPDGRTWKDLYYQLAGKQAIGVTGASHPYLLSPKFLQAHGGWDNVVWVSEKVAQFMAGNVPADKLPAACRAAIDGP